MLPDHTVDNLLWDWYNYVSVDEIENSNFMYFLYHVIKSRALSFQASEDPKQVNILKMV